MLGNFIYWTNILEQEGARNIQVTLYLKLAMDAGYELNRVYGYFKFAGQDIYKTYIDGNNKIKAEATKSGNKSLRDLSKLLSNIILYTEKIFKTY